MTWMRGNQQRTSGVRRPTCLALELLEPFHFGQLGPAQDSSALEQYVAGILELTNLSGRGSLHDRDRPFSSIFVPVTPGDLGVEMHVFPKIEDVNHLLQVGLDVLGAREK